MEIAVKVNENADTKGLYRSIPITIAIICIIPPKASIKIELDDLFMKNTTSIYNPIDSQNYNCSNNQN